MQLNFLQPHISITSLDADPLTPFAAITGLNGAGKTHLLQALLAGHVQIQGVTATEIVYFNYADFSVDANYTATQATDQGKHNQATNKLKQLTDLHTQRVKKIEQVTQPLLDPHEKQLWGLLRNEKQYESVMDERLWAESGPASEATNPAVQIADQLKAVDPSVNVSYDFVQEKWDSLSHKIHDQFEQHFPGYYDFVSGTNGSAAGVLRSNFARADFFAFDLAVQVRQYIYQQYINDHNEIRATKRGENVAFLTPEKFIETHGRPPLDLLNDVLEEFDCNGYRFAKPTYYPSPQKPINQVSVPLALVHKTEGFQTQIGNLSSGEQTLLALALAVHKARKSRMCRVLLLDEVDTSLHPSMTNQMLRALNGVFVEQQGMNVIMATHSPSTVALVPDDSVFLLKRGEKITLQNSTPADAIEFLTEGFATLDGSLKLMSSLSSDKVYIFSEGDNVAFIEKANEFFGNSGIEVVKGIESVSSDAQLKVLFDFFSRTHHGSKVFFVWDCDVDKCRALESQNGTHPHVFPQNAVNDKVTRGIENIFPKSVFTKTFYDSKPKEDGGTHSSLNKRRFKDYMIANGTESDFALFKPLFKEIGIAINGTSTSNEAAPTVA